MIPLTLDALPLIGLRAERRVAGLGAFDHHGDGVIQVEACRARPPRLVHPDPDLLC